MVSKIKIGVVKESERIPDRRVVLPPVIAKELLKRYPHVELYVQPSDYRCFSNKEYEEAGIELKEDLSDCDIFMGLKEMDIPKLIPGKTYLFFSHTAKKQLHNKPLLKALLEKKITMVDYEYLVDQNRVRLAAFGRWAGIVGAYNGVRARGERTGYFQLKPAHQCKDMEEMLFLLKKVKLKPMKILITGGGRVGHGAMEILHAMNIKKISPEQYLSEAYEEPVYAQLTPQYYVKHKEGGPFDLNHFYNFPQEYISTFLPYTKVTDIYIPCHFWDQRSPVFFTREDMLAGDFNISIVADISCDINGPIPSTIRASSITAPFYGYHTKTGKEAGPFDKDSVTVMAVDNLPGELPRDASMDFSKIVLEKVLPSLLIKDSLGIIESATITRKGKLTKPFSYLKDYVEDKE